MSGETILRFDCFGGRCGVYVEGDAPPLHAAPRTQQADHAQPTPTPGERSARAAERARASLLVWHRSFSRFRASSELSRLNADPRESVPVSPLMARLAAASRQAAEI